MKLNAILIALFATAAYAQDGRPNKAQMMALREEMRNAKVCLEFSFLFFSLCQNFVCVKLIRC